MGAAAKGLHGTLLPNGQDPVKWPEVTVEGRQRSKGCREEEDVKGKCLTSCVHGHYLHHSLSFTVICKPSLFSLHT